MSFAYSVTRLWRTSNALRNSDIQVQCNGSQYTRAVVLLSTVTLQLELLPPSSYSGTSSAEERFWQSLPLEIKKQFINHAKQSLFGEAESGSEGQEVHCPPGTNIFNTLFKYSATYVFPEPHNSNIRQPTDYVNISFNIILLSAYIFLKF
jgi:hypothetical protein